MQNSLPTFFLIFNKPNNGEVYECLFGDGLHIRAVKNATAPAFLVPIGTV